MRGKVFHRIEIIAEKHEYTLGRLHAGLDPESFYTALFSPQRPPTPEGFTLDFKVEVKGLMMELLLSQPLPPQLLPRQSPALKSRLDGTGLEGPKELYLEMQQTAMNVF